MSSMVAATLLAVSKVVVTVLLGAFTCKRIPFMTSTIRDFSFLITTVLLPCLTLYNVSMSVTVEVLIRCSLLLVFSVLFIATGIAFSLCFAKLLFRPSFEESGVPPALKGQVRLELLYHTPSSPRDADRRPTHQSRANPFVAVVLSEELEAKGVSGHDLVAQLSPPGTAVEAYPAKFWGFLVAMSILNTVTLPLSVFQNLAESVDWVDLETGTAYIFVFSMATTIFLWGGGPLIVAHSKRKFEKKRLVRKLMERHLLRSGQCDVATQTAVLEDSSATHGDLLVDPDHDPISTPVIVNDKSTQADTTFPGLPHLTPCPAVVEQFPYNWEEEGILKVVYHRTMHEADTLEWRSLLRRVWLSATNLYRSLSTNLPFLAILVAILIGVIPPLRHLFFGGPLSLFMDVIGLISTGAIPCCLLLLGANLANTGAEGGADEDDTSLCRDFEQNTVFPLHEEDLELVGEDASYASRYNVLHQEVDEFCFYSPYQLTEATETTSPPSSALQTAFSLKGVDQKFVWGAIGSRLVLLPAVTFICLVLLTRLMPFVFGGDTPDKTLLFVLFSQVAAPTGINTALLYNQANFMTYGWAKMLFYQYLLCTITTVTWTALSLVYVRNF